MHLIEGHGKEDEDEDEDRDSFLLEHENIFSHFDPRPSSFNVCCSGTKNMIRVSLRTSILFLSIELAETEIPKFIPLFYFFEREKAARI